MKVVRSRLMLDACLPPGAMVKAMRCRLMGDLLPHRAMVISRPDCCLGPCLVSSMSRSMALLKPGSVLISMAHAAIKGHTNSSGLGHHLGPCWYLGAILSLGPCQSG